MASQETHPREIDNVDARFEESKAKIKEDRISRIAKEHFCDSL